MDMGEMSTAPGMRGTSAGMARLMGVDPATGMADPTANRREFARQNPGAAMATGGAVSVAVEDTEGQSPRVKGRRERQWGDVGKAAEELPPVVAKMKKGGVVKRRPTSKKKVAKGEKLPVPTVTDDDMGAPPVRPAMAMPSPMPAPAAAPAPAGPPPVLPPGMKKGGECKMAEGGVAKLRRGFPNTNKKPAKRMATGGKVRGCGAAKRGTGFSGVF
jgi:hypothetical protein